MRSLGGYSEVLKRVLTRVDLPRPDSPETQVSTTVTPAKYRVPCLPTTITLKLKPFRTLLRCHWFGRLAKPTYPVSFLRTMFLISLAA